MTQDIHYLGHFTSLQSVWEEYPSGGNDGDYDKELYQRENLLHLVPSFLVIWVSSIRLNKIVGFFCGFF